MSAGKIMLRDIAYMKEALALASRGKGFTSPNPLVGAIVVKNNRIVGKGWHKRCGGDHAEIIALEQAGARASGATLYVTLEPCFHVGRTGPCVDAIIQAKLKQVVIAVKDPNSKTCGKSINKLKKVGMGVNYGVCEKEATAINEIFFKYIKAKMPFVVAKCAQTLDGKIATRSGDSKWITDKKTREYARKLRDHFDAILVGSRTILKDDPSLNGVNQSKRLKKVILDSALRISLQASVFKKAFYEDCYVAVTQKASLKKRKEFMNHGVNVIVCPHSKEGVDMKWLFKELAKMEITSILIEGGSKVLGSALAKKLVDQMNIYISPKILGDADALDSISGLTMKKIKQAIVLSHPTIKKIGPDFLVVGSIEQEK